MKRTLLAGLLAAALLVTTPAAHAETWRHTDARNDVIVDRYDDSLPPVEEEPGLSDLTRISARYDDDALVVASSIGNHCGNYWELRVATSRGDSFVLSRGIYSGEGCVESYVRARRNGDRFSCARLTVQRTRAGIVARVPRACLGSPYRVRIGLQLTTEDDYEAGARTYDDVLRTGKYTARKPKLSPWIVGS